MLRVKRIRSFTLFCLVTTVIEEAILVAVLLWLLPHFGISIPIWLFIVLVLAWAAWSYLTYQLGKMSIGKPPAVGPEAMVGTICQTTTPLYVRRGTCKSALNYGGHVPYLEILMLGLRW